MIEHVHPEGEPTPTVAELYERHDGSAEVAQWTTGSKDGKIPPKPSVYRLTDKGYRILQDIMKRNAEATLRRGSDSWETSEAIRRRSKEGEKNGGKGSQPTA